MARSGASKVPATKSARSVDARAAILEGPYIRGLMAQALKVAGADLKTGSGQVVLKSTIR